MTRLRAGLLVTAAVLVLLAAADWLGGQYLVQGVAQEYGVVDVAVAAVAGLLAGLCLLAVRRPGWWGPAAAVVGLGGVGYDLWLRLQPTTSHLEFVGGVEEPRTWQADAGLLLLGVCGGALVALLAVRLRYDRRRTR